jgi:hypothetical protein
MPIELIHVARSATALDDIQAIDPTGMSYFQ